MDDKCRARKSKQNALFTIFLCLLLSVAVAVSCAVLFFIVLYFVVGNPKFTNIDRCTEIFSTCSIRMYTYSSTKQTLYC
jgi:hypothetical protein